jgi:hypothetical protein
MGAGLAGHDKVSEPSGVFAIAHQSDHVGCPSGETSVANVAHALESPARRAGLSS